MNTSDHENPRRTTRVQFRDLVFHYHSNAARVRQTVIPAHTTHHMYTYTYTYTYKYTYTQTNIHIHARTCTHTHICTHAQRAYMRSV